LGDIKMVGTALFIGCHKFSVLFKDNCAYINNEYVLENAFQKAETASVIKRQ